MRMYCKAGATCRAVVGGVWGLAQVVQIHVVAAQLQAGRGLLLGPGNVAPAGAA